MGSELQELRRALENRDRREVQAAAIASLMGESGSGSAAGAGSWQQQQLSSHWGAAAAASSSSSGAGYDSGSSGMLQLSGVSGAGGGGGSSGMLSLVAQVPPSVVAAAANSW